MAKFDILLIGDDTDLLKMIGWVLNYKGFAVKVAACPEVALEALVKKNYDLVMARLTTNERESLDILQRARRLNPGVKLMVVSGNKDAIFPLEAYQVEVDDYLLMPVSPAELWRRVNRCLEDREVVDIQPATGSAAGSRAHDVADSQMALMLHDIRSSMVSSAAALKLMTRGMHGQMSETAKDKLRETTARLESTIHLTEDFIGKSLEDRPLTTINGDYLDLSEDIVDPVLAELATEIRDHQVKLVNRLHSQGNSKVPIRGSKVWLKCVFRNLMNNGIKYGGRGCTIEIDFEAQGSNGQLQVYNTGRSVPEACRSMLFSYDRKRPRTKKGCRGLGLGLSLSRDIIQNYGGDIWYEPKQGGSNFVMSLPQ
jgi:two-component system sensor histidine kinase/response regulator